MSKLFSPAAAAYIAGGASGRIPCPPVGVNEGSSSVMTPDPSGPRAGTVPLSRDAVIFVDATEFFSPCGQRITARVRIDCSPFSVGYPADRRIVESILLAALSHSCVGA